MQDLQDRIAFVQKLREFGETALGLNFGESFKHFAPDHPVPHWLYVAERYAVKSIFDWNGRPYIHGYDAHALDRKEELETIAGIFGALGFDIYLFAAEAWGGPKCPILPLLLQQSKIRQAYVVFHEGWHTTAYLQKIKLPNDLEEPVAIAVADVATRSFAETIGDAELSNALVTLRRTREKFGKAIQTSIALLQKGYEELKYKNKEEAEAMRRDVFAEIHANPVWGEAEKAGVMFGGISRFQPINNAFFVRYRSYYDHLPAVNARVNKLADPKSVINYFKKTPPQEILETVAHYEDGVNEK